MQFLSIFTSFLLFLNVGYSQPIQIDTTFICNQTNIRIATSPINDMQSGLTFTYEKCGSFVVDTVYCMGILNYQIIDFDKDNYLDFTLSYNSNTPITSVYLFDIKTNIHRKVLEMEKFPSSTQLPSNPKLFYSNHRNGCAESNWVSDLYKIDNFQAIQLGQIQVFTCDDLKEKYIEFKKVTEKGFSIEKKSYSAYLSETDDMRSLIEKYWNENYHLYE